MIVADFEFAKFYVAYVLTKMIQDAHGKTVSFRVSTIFRYIYRSQVTRMGFASARVSMILECLADEGYVIRIENRRILYRIHEGMLIYEWGKKGEVGKIMGLIEDCFNKP